MGAVLLSPDEVQTNAQMRFRPNVSFPFRSIARMRNDRLSTVLVVATAGEKHVLNGRMTSDLCER